MMRNVLFVSLIVAAAAGCATLQAAGTRSTEDNLRAAGFSIEVADTTAKRADLQTPPARQVLAEVRDGKTVYVYRDPTVCQCVYVGGEPQYRQYKRLQKDIADAQWHADENAWGWDWAPWGLPNPWPHEP